MSISKISRVRFSLNWFLMGLLGLPCLAFAHPSDSLSRNQTPRITLMYYHFNRMKDTVPVPDSTLYGYYVGDSASQFYASTNRIIIKYLKTDPKAYRIYKKSRRAHTMRIIPRILEASSIVVFGAIAVNVDQGFSIFSGINTVEYALAGGAGLVVSIELFKLLKKKENKNLFRAVNQYNIDNGYQ